MSTDEYVPDEEQVREAWRAFTGPNRDHGFDAFLARVREGAEAELDSWMARAYEAEKRAWQAEARIKAVRDVLDQAEAAINHHPAYTFSGQRIDPIVNGAAIRRALDG